MTVICKASHALKTICFKMQKASVREVLLDRNLYFTL